MTRPDYITNELLQKYDAILEKDTLVPEFFKKTALLKEVLYAGFWLKDCLEKEGAEEHIIVQIQFTHGARSFGSDCWKVAEELLAAYKAGELEFIDEAAVDTEIQEAISRDVPRDAKTQN